MGTSGNNDQLVISYLILRRAVGVLGVLFPLILAFGAWALGSSTGIEDSISDYYDTIMRGVFVGVLFAIGIFLFSYTGYERSDNIAGDLACVFALGVALFPVSSSTGAVRAVHFSSAMALFLTLSFFSLYLFTKTGGNPTPQKKYRNRVYVVSGVIMLVCIALIAVYFAFLEDTGIADIKPVFWLESLALWAFGVAWFVKGETLWKDAG